MLYLLRNPCFMNRAALVQFHKVGGAFHRKPQDDSAGLRGSLHCGNKTEVTV